MASKIYQEPRKLKICVASFFRFAQQLVFVFEQASGQSKEAKESRKEITFHIC